MPGILLATLRAAGRGAAALLWPARCAGCDAFLPDGQPFCAPCDASVLPLWATCRGCALPAGADGSLCPVCRARPPAHARAQAVLAYGGALTQALLRMKHGRRRDIARPLGRYLAPLLAAARSDGVDAVLPVPLHPRRLRARGFNQALDLVRGAGRPRDRPALLPDALRRLTDTPPLGRDPPETRRARLAGAFAVPRPGEIRGRRLLVVDDVMTSGATLDECARCLVEAGAAEVQVAALARALPGASGP